MLITAGLDFYKPTMSQVQFEQHRDAEVTFTFKNRGQQRLADYVGVEQLQARLDSLQQNGWASDELEFLASLRDTNGQPRFSTDFLDYLSSHDLPPVEVSLNETTNDLAIQTTGDWPMVTFWETVIMSEVNEIYFVNYLRQNNLDIEAIYAEGERRLNEKIAVLQANPDIKFSDFGTRRHFSLRWQKYVNERLMRECPNNFMGTSNVALAQSLEVKPIGTFAHEMPMVYAGIAQAMGKDIRASHHEMLEDWFDRYGEDLSTALTDTFTSEFFFSDFTPEQATKWRSLRHDSGDPIEFGERAIKFYEEDGIDPTTKTIVFSDGLDINEILKLHEYFKGRINMVFGWGTTLTNDLGIKALNVVMKATHVKLPTGQEADLVKLSDNVGKHTGPQTLVDEYQQTFGKED